ncbi:MAG TPA: NAD(P)/FAD-dependent oxidoreductase [Anaerolineae bacterium]|nr:NAD(P)/FAD-dependent oxidoreductase [Anaerolineae bacterium]
MTDPDILDTTIIGGGPSGLFAAFYAGLRASRTKIIDSLGELGGQLGALYPDKYIYDLPGFPRVQAREFVQRLVTQAMSFSPTLCLKEKVAGLRRRDDGIIELTTEPGRVHLSRTVIIAAGAGAFVPRTLDLPDVERMEGKGVHYYVRDLDVFRNKRVMVVGGGDTAVDWALCLLPIAREVYLVHRRGEFRAHEESVKEVFGSPGHVMLYHELKALHGQKHLQSATVFDNRTGSERTLGLDAIVLGLGFLANLGPIKSWGLAIAGNSIIVDHAMRTNIDGVFAVGDITMYEGKIKLIAIGTAEAAIAANYAKQHIDPATRLFPGHSSDRDKK